MPSTESQFLAILCVRNEAAFLLDWLSHHRATGFTDFLVFSNDCTDGTDLMLDRLDAMGWLNHVRQTGPFPEGPQWAALKAANDHPLVARARWIMVLDIDEFVNIHAGNHTLPALLSALPTATAIPLTWRLFGNGGIVHYEDRPVWETFTRAAPKVMGWPWRAALFKTLFRNDGTYTRLGVHRPRKPDPSRLPAQRWFDGSGRKLPRDFHRQRIFSPFGKDNYALAQINHYALGAMESYLLKCDRGRANREASAFDLSYWVERNMVSEDDRTLADRAALAAPNRRELLADTALASLHRTAVTWRKNRFATLMADEDYRALFARLLMSPGSRVLTMTETRFLLSFAGKHGNEE